MPPFLSVVIPAYNEEKRLGKSLAAVEAHLASKPEWKAEVLVVDDGSSDGTVAAAEQWGGRLPGLRVVKNPRNMGKGATIKNGMLQAKGRWRLFTDADNSTPFEQVDRLLAAAEEREADVLLASRACKGAELEKRQPLRRELMGRCFNLIVQALALPGIKDSQCGFKLFSADAAEAIFPRMTRQGFSFDVEALFLARRLGFTLAEVPVRWIDDEQSKVNPLVDSAKMFADLLAIRWTHSRVQPEWPAPEEPDASPSQDAGDAEAAGKPSSS